MCRSNGGIPLATSTFGSRTANSPLPCDRQQATRLSAIRLFATSAFLPLQTSQRDVGAFSWRRETGQAFAQGQLVRSFADCGVRHSGCSLDHKSNAREVSSSSPSHGYHHAAVFAEISGLETKLLEVAAMAYPSRGKSNSLDRSRRCGTKWAKQGQMSAAVLWPCHCTTRDAWGLSCTPQATEG